MAAKWNVPRIGQYKAPSRIAMLSEVVSIHGQNVKKDIVREFLKRTQLPATSNNPGP
jgi:hypothetical protein